jgi:hypothetical protein
MRGQMALLIQQMQGDHRGKGVVYRSAVLERQQRGGGQISTTRAVRAALRSPESTWISLMCAIVTMARN